MIATWQSFVFKRKAPCCNHPGSAQLQEAQYGLAGGILSILEVDRKAKFAVCRPLDQLAIWVPCLLLSSYNSLLFVRSQRIRLHLVDHFRRLRCHFQRCHLIFNLLCRTSTLPATS